MSRLSLLMDRISGKDRPKENPYEYQACKECVGCDKTEGLEMCDGTMCLSCWEAENQEPNMEESNA